MPKRRDVLKLGAVTPGKLLPILLTAFSGVGPGLRHGKFPENCCMPVACAAMANPGQPER